MFLLLREGKERDKWLPKPRDSGKEQEESEQIPALSTEGQRLSQQPPRLHSKTSGPFSRDVPRTLFLKRCDAQMVPDGHVISPSEELLPVLAGTGAPNHCGWSREQNFGVGPE
jgi:hypothetical protein